MTLRCKGFQRSYGVHLNSSPCGIVDRCRNLSQCNVGRLRVSSMMVKTLQSKATGSFLDGYRRAFTTHFKLECSNVERLTLTNVFNHASLGGGIGLSLSCSRAFPKRCFSGIPRVSNRKDGVCVTDASNLFGKNWKQSKPLAAAHSAKSAATPKLSTPDNVGNVIPENMYGGDGNEDIDIINVKHRGQQGRKKKNKENLAESTVSDPLHTDDSKRVSKAKVPNTSESGHVTQASEKIITGTGPVEVNGHSKSRNNKSKRTPGSSSLQVQSDEACIDIGTNGSSLKQNPKNIGKTKGPSQRIFKQLYPATGKSVVVVESLTKAKVIQRYLGDMYEVLPSYGHVRDLAGRGGSVRPDDDFSMIWEVPPAAWTHLKSINVALRGAQNLILASDPDREGEAIAWHILEMLKQQDSLPKDIVVSRVVFHEITENSIKAALQTPRDIDANLVDAYLARRALDYLIGFTISPLLWRKLPSCPSAGRVQSAALSLICDREMEIDEFNPEEYWSAEALFKKNELDSLISAFSISAHLTHFNSKKLNQFSINSDTAAKDIEQKINTSKFEVVGVKKSKIRKNPPTPYITSTLQQDAATKLGFSATHTMKLAQKLYEGVELSDGKVAGLITYTRTDGLNISAEAVKDIHSLIIERYGSEFVPDSPRKFFKKVKNAQEAHEAIRPTNIRRLPKSLVGLVDENSMKLYALIWSRTMACQMELAIIDQIQLDISAAGKGISFRSTCSKVGFLGYQAAYQNVEEEAVVNEGSGRVEMYKFLDSLKKGDQLSLGKVELKQHHTSPPPRYSEGTLVKKLEELGIGRPSTYAVTLRVLQDRKYVTTKNRVLYPEFRGRMLSAFLANHFSEVTEYGFTANMESELDNVSAGMTEWKGLLKDYWTRFSSYCTGVRNVHIREVEKMLEKTFGNFLFASLPDKSRKCPSCKEGTLSFKVSRFGAGYFLGCDQHPKCKYIAKTLYGNEEDDDDTPEHVSLDEPKLLGTSPGSSEKVLLKKGPYGFYVQLGEDRKGSMPKRASVSQIKDVNSITLEDALEILRYPLTLGNHPVDNKPVIIKLATAGFSIRHKSSSVNVPKNMKANEVTLEKALKLLLSKDVKQSGRPKSKGKV